MASLKYEQSPYKVIPDELQKEYTMNGQIPVFDWYFDGRNDLHKEEWTQNYIHSFVTKYTIENIKYGNEGPSPYGHEVCMNLLKSFEDYNIKNKKVAVVGSTSPWIEAILINLQNEVTTIEYNVPNTNFDNLQCKDYFNYFKKNTETFDAVVTFSSVEHSGLGRYGDPLNPNEDINTMDSIYNNLLDNGLLIWGAPVGKDALSWNAHRVYGPIRLPLMFNKFEELKWYGRSKEFLFSQPLSKNAYQPVVVLKK